MKDGEDQPTACKEYEARLEDYLDFSPGTRPGIAEESVAAHLEHCPRCCEALEAARLSRELLREGRESAREPGGAFLARVIAAIRDEEARRLAPSEFWRPLEVLAYRLTLAAAVALLILAVYLFQSAPARTRAQVSSQAEVSEGLPEPARPPANHDEVLLSLAGNGYGR